MLEALRSVSSLQVEDSNNSVNSSRIDRASREPKHFPPNHIDNDEPFAFTGYEPDVVPTEAERAVARHAPAVSPAKVCRNFRKHSSASFRVSDIVTAIPASNYQFGEFSRFLSRLISIPHKNSYQAPVLNEPLPPLQALVVDWLSTAQTCSASTGITRTHG
jgi:hypothetical protein